MKEIGMSNVHWIKQREKIISPEELRVIYYTTRFLHKSMELYSNEQHTRGITKSPIRQAWGLNKGLCVGDLDKKIQQYSFKFKNISGNFETQAVMASFADT